MWHYLWKHRAINGLAIIALFAISAFSVLANIALMHLLQKIIELDVNQFVFWMLISSGAWFFIIMFEYAETFLQGYAIRIMNSDVRRDIAEMLVQKEHHEFYEKTTGEYISLLINDVNQLENLSWKPFFDCIKSFSMVLFTMVALFLLHWSLLASSIFIAFVMFFLPKLFDKKMKKLGDECAQEQAKATNIMKDLLNGYGVLSAFNRLPLFSQGISDASEQIEFPKFRLLYTKAGVGCGMDFINIICQMLLNMLIGFLSIKGVIIQGALLGGGNLCGALSNGLCNMSNMLLSFSASKAYFDRIAIKTKQTSTETSTIDPLTSAIVVDKVSFTYDEKPVLKDASFSFCKGGKYALVGPSGCGKTTVLKLLLGWLPGYVGTILFDKIDISTCIARQLQQQIGYIDQDVFLFDSTIRYNITLGRDFTDEQLQKAIEKSALKDDLAAMPQGLETPVGENGSNLSGGQKQRIAVARALIYHKSVLLLDEGTSALDRENADIIENSLLANPELTLIMVSHHLSPEKKEQFTQIYDLGAA